MRTEMEKMEDERAQMIAEVEAQIEKALASMIVDLDDSDYDSRSLNYKICTCGNCNCKPFIYLTVCGVIEVFTGMDMGCLYLVFH